MTAPRGVSDPVAARPARGRWMSDRQDAADRLDPIGIALIVNHPHRSLSDFRRKLVFDNLGLFDPQGLDADIE